MLADIKDTKAIVAVRIFLLFTNDVKIKRSLDAIYNRKHELWYNFSCNIRISIPTAVCTALYVTHYKNNTNITLQIYRNSLLLLKCVHPTYLSGVFSNYMKSGIALEGSFFLFYCC